MSEQSQPPSLFNLESLPIETFELIIENLDIDIFVGKIHPSVASNISEKEISRVDE